MRTPARLWWNPRRPVVRAVLLGIPCARDFLHLLACAAAAIGCGEDPREEPKREACSVTLAPSSDDQTAVQTAFLQAAAGDAICFEDGVFRFEDELSISVPGLTLRGVGDSVVFDFAAQPPGASGLKVTGDDFTIENLTLANARADGIRAEYVDGVTFRRLRVRWDGGPGQENGAYAIRAIGCTNVRIEHCEVSGASRAGISVGQSRKAIVRDNVVHGNVAGIEIENSVDAEVHGNEVRDNAGGILVLNLPHLPSGSGRRALVRDNVVEGNNRMNFAPPGSVVALVPPGTGVMVLAADETEIRDNVLRNNRSAGVLVLSYPSVVVFDLDAEMPDDPEYDVFSSATWIHANTFDSNGYAALGALAPLTATGEMADVVWDGFDDPEIEGTGLCIQSEGASFCDLNLDSGTSSELGDHDCALDPLPSVSF